LVAVNAANALEYARLMGLIDRQQDRQYDA